MFLLVLFVSLLIHRSTPAALSNSNIAPRIINGQEAPQGKWPMMVELMYRRTHLGGGTILNRNSILVAAHSLSHPAEDLTVYIGHVHIQKGKRDQDYVYQVDHYVFHPLWVDNEHVTVYDVAVIKLARNIELKHGDRENIQSTCLANPNDTFIADQCIFIGWGMNENLRISPNLMEMHFPPLTAEQAGEDSLLDEYYIIVGYRDGEGDVCTGDGGGPLLCPTENDPDRYYQFGLLAQYSHKRNLYCGKGPPRFTKISLYLDYIRQQTECDGDC